MRAKAVTTAAVAREPGHRSRRASSDVEEAILRATLDILDEAGFEKLTVEAVAARAGAAKTAVYRRWPSKVPLVVEALTRSRPQPAVPDTGDLRDDMIALWTGMTGDDRRSVERMLSVFRTSLAAGDELRTLLWERYFEPRLQASYAVIARAAARGQVRADADPALAFDLLFGPLIYRWLRGSPPDEETIGQVVELALRGLAPLFVPAMRPRLCAPGYTCSVASFTLTARLGQKRSIDQVGRAPGAREQAARTGTMYHRPGPNRVDEASTRLRAGPACGWRGTGGLLGCLGQLPPPITLGACSSSTGAGITVHRPGRQGGRLGTGAGSRMSEAGGG